MTNLVDSLKAPPRAGVSRGLTLIEMLVALAVTLVMMAAVVNLFANMSASIRNRRAAIETGSQLRQVRNRLAMDLSGATCRGSTWQDPAENQGYIEIIEGEWSDKNPSILIDGVVSGTNAEIDYTTSLIPSSQGFSSEDAVAADGRTLGLGAVTDGRALGDWDDVLALTVRSESDPFVGRVLIGGVDQLIESPLAEVVWFATEQPPSTPADPNDGMRRIYRRVLLIAPWLGALGTNIDNPPNNISAHWEQTGATIDVGRWIANTLGDVTKRENRAGRNPRVEFPHPLVRSAATLLPGSTSTDALVLSSALAFDVRVYDPGAPLFAASAGPNSSVLEPNDFGWATLAAGTPVGYGAYCDLGWNQLNPTTPYYTPPAIAPSAPIFGWPRQAGWHPIFAAGTPPQSLTEFPAVYDTWSYHYENDGLDQETKLQNWFSALSPVPPNAPTFLAYQTSTFDQGANGLDDDNANGVDDRGERETAPPYDVPLRGVKVILRVYEPDARQIRESSVTHSFKQ